MRGKIVLALLVIGLVVLSAGCIGGGGENTSTKSPSHTTWNQGTTSSKSSTTTTLTRTTPTYTTGSPQIPEVSPEELGDYVGKNVSVEGSLLGMTYNSSSHTYILTVGGTDVAVKVSVGRDLLDALNPLNAGIGSKLRIIGEVKSKNELVASKIEVVASTKPELSRVEDLSPDMLGRIVVVEGNVVSSKEIGSNLKLVITDGTGEIAVFIPGSVVKEISNDTLSKLHEGLGVKIGGYLDEYKGTLEVIPYTAEGIVAYGEPLQISTTTTTTTTTTSTTTQTETEWVTVSGLSSASGTVQLNATWVKLYYSKPNYLIEVSDDTGKVNLTVDRALLPNPIEAGTGSLLHLTVDTSSMKVVNLSVVTPQPSPLLSTSNVTFELMGTTVVVEGDVMNFQTLGSNLKFLVVDDSGNITVFVPSSVVSKLPEDVKNKLNDGVHVRIGGYVTEYKGTVEIIPYSSRGVKVLS